MPANHASSHRIQPLTLHDVPNTAELLGQTFPESMLTVLGQGFVKELVSSFVTEAGAVAYVAVCDEGVVGFVVGAEDASRHRSVFLRRRWRRLLLHAFRRLATSPWLVWRPVAAWRLVRYTAARAAALFPFGRRRRVSQPGAPMPAASLILLAVAPSHRRLGVADQLTQAFLDALAERGVESVKLAVAVSNEPALTFYRSRGWVEAGHYRTPEGAEVLRLIYHLTRPNPAG